jgi:ketosteroid isomerase-like protein
VNNQDIDGLMALYAEDASMVLVDGSIVTGLPAIREEWGGASRDERAYNAPQSICNRSRGPCCAEQ